MPKKHLTYRYSKPYSARGALYVLLVVLSVVFTMATALSVADFLKILFGEGEGAAVATGNLVAQWLEGLYRWLIGFGRLNALLLFSALIFVLYSLKNIFGYLSTVEIGILRTRVVRDLRNDLFHKAMRLPMSYYSQQRKGDVLARFGSDMVEYDESVLGSIQMLLTAAISMVLYMAMLLYLNVKLTLFVLCMLPLVAFVISGLSRRLKQKSKAVQEMNSWLISLTDETIGGLKVIKAYTAIDFSNSRFRAFNRDYTRQRTAMFRRIYAASPVSDFLGNCVVIAIILFGSSMVISGASGITPELFVSYIMMFVLMIPPAKELTTAISQMKKGRACVDRMQQFLDEGEDVADRPDAGGFTGLRQQIEFRDITFSYLPGTEVLSHINLTIPRGAMVALVGSSGSGKSTLADLLMRLYEPDSGQILLDGQPIQSFRIESLRRHIGVVAQNTFLFNDSVRNNIAYGMPHATDAQIEAAARTAYAHDFILQLPDGYDTHIGDAGALLSGGQRQRISIARAILAEPDILIFDEATSALDTESEALVQQALDTLLSGRTALVIAHRLSTVRHADLIVVVEQGHIVETGTHDQLLARKGRYHQLVQLQNLS